MNKESALLRLTDRQRELIRLRDHEKLTFREVAQRLDFSTGYATKLYHEAVKELRQLEEVDELEWKNPPQADSEPAPGVPEPALEIPQVSPQRKPLVAIATATSKPKVKWVTGVPMVLPKQGPVSVTIRS
jgi:hypothetical protein